MVPRTLMLELGIDEFNTLSELSKVSGIPLGETIRQAINYLSDSNADNPEFLEQVETARRKRDVRSPKKPIA